MNTKSIEISLLLRVVLFAMLYPKFGPYMPDNMGWREFIFHTIQYLVIFEITNYSYRTITTFGANYVK